MPGPYDAILDDIDAMLGSPLGDIGRNMPAMPVLTSLGGTGLGENFHLWPTVAEGDAARRYQTPSSGGVSSPAPDTPSPGPK